MRTIPFYNFNEFDVMAGRLQLFGFEPISPADIDREEGFEPHDLPPDHDWTTLPEHLDMRHLIARDVAALCRCDAYVLLDGWERSTGATAEKTVADWIGLPRLDPETFQPWQDNLLLEADRITSQDRQNSYGHPIDHWTRTVEVLRGLTNDKSLEMHPETVGLLWICDKLARYVHGGKRDNLVDIAGYARCIEKVHQERARRT
jgi:hypothetical protein